MKKKTLLEQWAHAARCRRRTSQLKAHNLWNVLKPQLSSKDATALSIAWSHAIMAEQSPRELDGLTKELVDRYKHLC